MCIVPVILQKFALLLSYLMKETTYFSIWNEFQEYELIATLGHKPCKYWAVSSEGQLQGSRGRVQCRAVAYHVQDSMFSQ